MVILTAGEKQGFVILLLCWTLTIIQVRCCLHYVPLEQLPGAPPWQTRLGSEHKSLLHALVFTGSRREMQRVAAGKGKHPSTIWAQVWIAMSPWTWQKPQSLYSQNCRKLVIKALAYRLLANDQNMVFPPETSIHPPLILNASSRLLLFSTIFVSVFSRVLTNSSVLDL